MTKFVKETLKIYLGCTNTTYQSRDCCTKLQLKLLGTGISIYCMDVLYNNTSLHNSAAGMVTVTASRQCTARRLADCNTAPRTPHPARPGPMTGVMKPGNGGGWPCRVGMGSAYDILGNQFQNVYITTIEFTIPNDWLIIFYQQLCISWHTVLLYFQMSFVFKLSQFSYFFITPFKRANSIYTLYIGGTVELMATRLGDIVKRIKDVAEFVNKCLEEV